MFLTLENEFLEHENLQLEIANQTIANSTVKTSTPKKSPIPRPPLPAILTDKTNSLNETESLFLKTSFTMSKTNLDASIEAAEEKNRKVIQDIVDPTPGFVVEEKITDDDFSNREYEDESKFKLGNASQQGFDNILKEINQSITDFKETSSTYEFPNKSDQNRKDLAVKKEQDQLEILKSPLQTKISTVKKRNQKTSPYNLRSFKRKREYLGSGDLLRKPYIYQSIDDKESNKIKAAGTVVDSIVKQLPDRSKKLKFDLDSSNDIKLTEL